MPAKVRVCRWALESRRNTDALRVGLHCPACLETIVHLGADDLPINRYLVEIDIADTVWTAAAQLDRRKYVGWDAIPVGKTSLDAGEAWARSQSSALLFVPSVIAPEEANILLNPLHSDAASIRARKLRRWTCDVRLRQGA